MILSLILRHTYYNITAMRYFSRHPPILAHSDRPLQDESDDLDIIENHVFQVSWEYVR